jgi:hypothetical protein
MIIKCAEMINECYFKVCELKHECVSNMEKEHD